MCPITFAHPKEAISLEWIGPGITGRLTKALQKYCDDHGQEMPEESELPLLRSRDGRTADVHACSYSGEEGSQGESSSEEEEANWTHLG